MLNAGKELIKRHAHWLSPKWMGADGTWEMVVQSWIVIVDRWDCRRPDHRRVAANDGVFENSVLPVVHAGLAELVPDRYRISPGLEIEPAPGHTLGHVALHLASSRRISPRRMRAICTRPTA